MASIPGESAQAAGVAVVSTRATRAVAIINFRIPIISLVVLSTVSTFLYIILHLPSFIFSRELDHFHHSLGIWCPDTDMNA